MTSAFAAFAASFFSFFSFFFFLPSSSGSIVMAPPTARSNDNGTPVTLALGLTGSLVTPTESAARSIDDATGPDGPVSHDDTVHAAARDPPPPPPRCATPRR